MHKKQKYNLIKNINNINSNIKFKNIFSYPKRKYIIHIKIIYI